MARAQFAIVLTTAIFSIIVCGRCLAGKGVERNVTGEVEIQWPGGGGMGGGCGGEEGGGCDCGGEEDSGTDGGCGGEGSGGADDGCGGEGGGMDGGKGGETDGGCGGEGSGGADGGCGGGGMDGGMGGGTDGGCGGAAGGGCGSGTKYAYVSLSAHRGPSGETSGTLRHWVTNERIEIDGTSETEEVASGDASDDSNLHRDIIVQIEYVAFEGGHARLVGLCTYDSKAMQSKAGKWLLADVVDGGTPAREGDTLAWKWFPTKDAALLNIGDPSLNPKEILAGNLLIHE